VRRTFVVVAVLVLAAIGGLGLLYPAVLLSLVVVVPLVALGVWDMLQRQHAVLRNFPLIGHFRYLFEAIRPEISQYFIETDWSGMPFNREQRSVVYRRAKEVRDTIPFGTLRDLYAPGYEWVNHSIRPTHVDWQSLRVSIGGRDCRQPYSASLLNVSAMSFGSLSSAAVTALNRGAHMGGFAHNTGEGGISPYHLEGGDLIWQLGTGYFGARDAEGRFSAERFSEQAARPAVRMVEVKLSQGAKPGHGGILPAAKLTPEIAAIRGVPLGRDVLSPPGHSAFSTPIELLEFVARLRELSGGKPIGIKLCVGKRREFLAICKAAVKTGIAPDYVAVDGGEGGTGAAPVEFANHIGTPLVEGVIFVHNALVGFGLRSEIRVLASGKIVSGFDLIKRLALGADAGCSARAMMLALGCIQALRCNSNHCPVGVATQNPELVAGLVPSDKARRVAAYHRELLESVAEILGAMGMSGSGELRPWHVMRRTGPDEVHHYGEIHEFLEEGALLGAALPRSFARASEAASPETFEHRAG